jgi:steroid 5-alpha reductase family enzyme
MGVALMYTSRLMYNTLVYYTGAIPSEYYSVLKRSGYKDYQKQTAMFFPSLPKE